MESNAIKHESNIRVIANSINAKSAAIEFIGGCELKEYHITFGLPELSTRYQTWRVPLLYSDVFIGEFIFDSYTGNICSDLSSSIEMIKRRILSILESKSEVPKSKNTAFDFTVSDMNSMVIKGKSEVALKFLKDQSIDLVFTSPPYYNARKQYSEYESYSEYLNAMRTVIRECRRVLIDGKFLIINSSPIIVPRNSRNECSTRLAVPFDLHQICMDEGFEFVDDIVWKKTKWCWLG